MFQSAPGQLAGRCHGCPSAHETTNMFQSAPGQLAGRCAVKRPLCIYASEVSIRARPIGRAMPPFRVASDHWQGVSIRARPIGRAMPWDRHDRAESLLFQSAPGQLAGRCRSRSPRRSQCHEVSIRARPIGRAMPLPVRRKSLFTRCFNPRPANWPGDASVGLICSSITTRFNPRPANWPGDAGVHGYVDDWRLVSIRARPIGRAMLGRYAHF